MGSSDMLSWPRFPYSKRNVLARGVVGTGGTSMSCLGAETITEMERVCD